eukprot:Colp12_sorted_trinity150504_noHs@23214
MLRQLLVSLVLCGALVSGLPINITKKDPNLEIVQVPIRDGPNPPEQFMLSLTGKDGEMTVTYMTPEESFAICSIGTSAGDLKTTVKGKSNTYTFDDYESGYIHRVVFKNLQPKTTYFYKCGDESVQASETFKFTTPAQVGRNNPVVFSVIGDVGQTSYSIDTYKHVVGDESIEVAVHVGDLSYANSVQTRWDNWGRIVEKVSAQTPYMVAVGNHEVEKSSELGKNFLAYQTRFATPDNGMSSEYKNLWYSFNVGNAHWIILNSYSSFTKGTDQYNWLVADLASIDRSATPWVFVLVHAPWYNSNEAHQDEKESYGMKAAMEKLVFDAKVDVVFAGHVHAYERSSRIYNDEINSEGPYYINIGDGGNREGLADTFLDQPEWSEVRHAAFGYGRLETVNATHAHWLWQPDDLLNVQSDSFWIVKN